eukprot:scaffold42691_cov78-Cyclotella_meneghiniana.AAC.12
MDKGERYSTSKAERYRRVIEALRMENRSAGVDWRCNNGNGESELGGVKTDGHEDDEVGVGSVLGGS